MDNYRNKVRKLSFVLHAGEVMFNSYNTPHQVKNIGASLGVVGLWICQDNLDDCLTHTADIIKKMEDTLKIMKEDALRKNESKKEEELLSSPGSTAEPSSPSEAQIKSDEENNSTSTDEMNTTKKD